MTKKSWLIITIISLLIGLLYYTCFKSDLLGHHFNNNICKNYLWFFKDSIRKDLDTADAFSWIKSKDIYNDIHYQDSIDITIWEFKNLTMVNLDSVKINDKNRFSAKSISSGETLNPGSYLASTLRHLYSLNNGININLDFNSSIEKFVQGNSFKGFYGNVKQISIDNNEGESQIIFNYLSRENLLFLVYKFHEGLFIIIINCKTPLNTDLINILNLK